MSQETTHKLNKNLEGGDRIVLMNGVLDITGDVYMSSMAPGLLIVETEAGCLYLDPDLTTETVN